MNLKPLADRIVVKAAAAEEVTKGGIFLPDTAQENPQQGEIVAIGPGRISDDGKVIAPAVAVGDNILYGKYSVTEVTVDGTEYLIMRESDIFAVIGAEKKKK